MAKLSVYTKEFKRKAIKDYLNSDKNIREFAQHINVPKGTFTYWLHRYQDYGIGCFGDSFPLYSTILRDVEPEEEDIEEEITEKHLVGVYYEGGSLRRQKFGCQKEIYEQGYRWILKDSKTMELFVEFLKNMQNMNVDAHIED